VTQTVLRNDLIGFRVRRSFADLFCDTRLFLSPICKKEQCPLILQVSTPVFLSPPYVSTHTHTHTHNASSLFFFFSSLRDRASSTHSLQLLLEQFAKWFLKCCSVAFSLYIIPKYIV